MATPSTMLPPVAASTLSLLKKMPDPMQMPMIIASAVKKPYFFCTGGRRLSPSGCGSRDASPSCPDSVMFCLVSFMGDTIRVLGA